MFNDFDSLAHACPQNEAVPVTNELVFQDEGIKLLRASVHWRIDKDDAGRFDVMEAEENAPEHWKGTFGTLEDAKHFIVLRKMQLQQL